nr:ATP synthase F0 subunit 8 [Cyphoderus sp.]
MPQMYPLFWLILFLMFSLMMIIMLTKLFFNKTYKNSKQEVSNEMMIEFKNKHWAW